MKTNSFTWFDVAYTNIKSKTKINGPLPDPSSLMRISSEVSTLILFYITVVEVLAIFRGCIDKGARGHALPHCFAKQKKKCSSWKINKKHEIVKKRSLLYIGNVHKWRQPVFRLFFISSPLFSTCGNFDKPPGWCQLYCDDHSGLKIYV